jgi:hypothetical protein
MVSTRAVTHVSIERFCPHGNPVFEFLSFYCDIDSELDPVCCMNMLKDIFIAKFSTESR